MSITIATELHQDLVYHLVDNKSFGRTVDHPLVRLIPLGMPFESHPAGFADSTAFIMACTARTGSPGCLPEISRSNLRNLPAVAA